MFRKFEIAKKDKLKIEYEIPNFSHEILKEASLLNKAKPKLDTKCYINEASPKDHKYSYPLKLLGLSESQINITEENTEERVKEHDEKINEKFTLINNGNEDRGNEIYQNRFSDFENDLKTNLKYLEDKKEIDPEIQKEKKNGKKDRKSKILINSAEKNLTEKTSCIDENEIPCHSLVDIPKILIDISKMEELKKNITTPLDRIFKDIYEFKEQNYPSFKFRLLIFQILRGNGLHKDINLFQDYMYLRRIGLTPEKLSKITNEELSRLTVKKIMTHYPIEKLRKIAEIIFLDYNGEVPENSVELNRILTCSSKNANCASTVEKYLKLLSNQDIPQIKINSDVVRISHRLRWTNEYIHDKLLVDLKEKIPQEIWNKINPLLTAFGQDICMTKPHCHRCPFTKDCKFYNRNLDKPSEEYYHPLYTKLIKLQKTKKSSHDKYEESNIKDVNHMEDIKQEIYDDINKYDKKGILNHAPKLEKSKKSLKRKADQYSNINIHNKYKK